MPEGFAAIQNDLHFFTVRVTDYQNRLPKQAVKSPSLEILKKLPGHSPEQPTLGYPHLSRGDVADDLQMSLPTSPIL